MPAGPKTGQRYRPRVGVAECAGSLRAQAYEIQHAQHANRRRHLYVQQAPAPVLLQRERVSLRPVLVGDFDDDRVMGDLVRQLELVHCRCHVCGAGIVG